MLLKSWIHVIVTYKIGSNNKFAFHRLFLIKSVCKAVQQKHNSDGFKVLNFEIFNFKAELYIL